MQSIIDFQPKMIMIQTDCQWLFWPCNWGDGKSRILILSYF